MHPLFIQNLKFLQDFWIHPFDVPPAQETQVLALLATAPGISITQLQDACPDLPVDVPWALLTQQRIFTDLEASSLMQWDQVLLYCSPREAEEQRRRTSAMPQPLPLFARFLWDGRLWEAEKQGEHVLRQAILGQEPTLLHAAEHPAEISIDFAHIPQFEEYR